MATMTPSFPNSIYTYETLEGQPEQTVRILTVAPGNTNLISCSLSNVRLNDRPNYKALSYVWGNEDSTKTIVIDGKKFMVRPILWKFLDRFQRHHGAPACVWIDAICVNQHDVSERNSQVLLMTKIYTQAAVVYSWLELGEEHQMTGCSDLIKLVELGKTKLRARIIVRPEVRPAVSAACQTVARLVSNAYWSRVWIVQEVVLGQQVFIWYGSAAELSLESLARIYIVLASIQNHELLRYGLILASNREAFDRGNYFNSLLKSRYVDPTSGNYDRTTERKSVQVLLEETSTTRCTDVRDKLYAFLNLASDSKRYGITPDYGKPPADLFYDFIITTNNVHESFYSNTTGMNNEFPRLWRSRLRLTYADLCANSRAKVSDESALNGFETYSKLMADIAWILQEEGEGYHLFPVILIGPILDIDRSPDNWREIAKYPVEIFLAALTAGLRGQRAALRQNSALANILGRLETQDAFLTLLQQAPVALYHLGHRERPLPTESVQQKPEGPLVPRGIVRYILEEVVVVKSLTLRDEWNEIVQRALHTQSFV